MMKKNLHFNVLILLIVVVFFLAVKPLWANNDQLRILVLPLDNKGGLSADNLNEAFNIIQSVIEQSIRFNYISPEDFCAKWSDLIELEENDNSIFSNDILIELKNAVKNFYKNPNTLKSYFETDDDLGTLSEQNQFKAIDLVLTGSIDNLGDNNEIYLILKIINIENGRLLSKKFQIAQDNWQNVLKQNILAVLNESINLRITYADKLTDHVMSIVTYEIEDQDGNAVQIEVDYTSMRPSPNIQNIKIIEPKNLSTEGKEIHNLVTKQGKTIQVIFSYKNNKLDLVSLRTEYPKNIEMNSFDEELSVLSKGGYVLRFVFQWENKEIKNVRIEPEINPFS